MPHSNTVYRQLFSPELRNIFRRIVREHDGDRGVRTLMCWNQFLAMMFAQITGRRSLRDVAAGFNSGAGKLYHLGAKPLAYNSLAHANKTRPWRMYQALATELYSMCRSCDSGRRKFRFKSELFMLDSTLVSLPKGPYPWAEHRSGKSGVKLHALVNHNGTLPAFAVVTPGKVHDVVPARRLPLEPGSIVVFDRAYLDYAMLYSYHKKGVFFVTRLKKNSRLQVVETHRVKPGAGVLRDQTVSLDGQNNHKYPERLRRVTFRDEDGRQYEFLTNRFDLAASTIAEIYKARWDIELFFKWIKQNLKIKSFLGTSENAVLTQIWIAICAYLLISYQKFVSRSRLPLVRILSLVQLFIFYPIPLRDLLNERCLHPPQTPCFNQLSLEGLN